VAWLQRHGIADARIDNIDLNLFAGTAEIDGLHSGDGLHVDHLRLDFDWLPLFSGIVHIRTLTLSGSALHLSQRTGIWRVVGISAGSSPTPAGGQDSSSWRLIVDDLLLKRVQLDIDAEQFHLSVPLKSLQLSLTGRQAQQQRLRHRIEIGKSRFSGYGYEIDTAGAQLSGDLTLALQQGDFAASLRGDRLSFSANGLSMMERSSGRSLAADQLTLDGAELGDAQRIRIASLALEQVHISRLLAGQGTLRLAALKAADLEGGADGAFIIGRLHLQQAHAGQFGKGRPDLEIAAASATGLVLGSAADVQTGTWRLQIGALTVSGGAMRQLNRPDSRLSFKQLDMNAIEACIDGSLKMQHLRARQLQAAALLQADQGLRAQQLDMQTLSIRAGRGAQLAELRIANGELYRNGGVSSEQLLAAFKLGVLKAASLDGTGRGAVAEAALDGLDLPGADPAARVAIAHLRLLRAGQRQTDRYDIKQLRIEGLQARVLKQQRGWALPLLLTGSDQSAPVSARKDRSTEPSVVIDELLIDRGSRIALRDESVTPPLNTAMQVRRFRIAPLDSGGAMQGALKAEILLDKTGVLNISGRSNIATGSRLHADLRTL
jgi:hypothetical protein